VLPNLTQGDGALQTTQYGCRAFLSPSRSLACYVQKTQTLGRLLAPLKRGVPHDRGLGMARDVLPPLLGLRSSPGTAAVVEADLSAGDPAGENPWGAAEAAMSLGL